MKVHKDFMGWSCMRLVWHGTLVQVWIKMGTLHRCQQPTAWHFCRFEICCSYCCSFSMKGILMMLPSTTRGDFAQPHGLETERDGNTAQMSSATCSLVFLHTLKSSPIMSSSSMSSTHILYYVTQRGVVDLASCILQKEPDGTLLVCTVCVLVGCLVALFHLHLQFDNLRIIAH